MNGRMRNGVISAVIAASMMTGGVPAVALASESAASIQTRLQAARAEFDDLALKSARAGESLNDTRYQLDQTRRQKEEVSQAAEKTRGELKEARDVLAERVAANYRAGNRSLVDMVLSSSTFDEFVGAVYYADKAVESDTAMINTVKTKEETLTKQEGELAQLEEEQTELVAQQEELVAELEERQVEQANFIKGLDAQMRQKLDEQLTSEISVQKQAGALALATQQPYAAAAAAVAAAEPAAAAGQGAPAQQQTPAGQTADGQAPAGQTPADQATEGQAPAGQPAEGQAPAAQASQPELAPTAPAETPAAQASQPELAPTAPAETPAAQPEQNVEQQAATQPVEQTAIETQVDTPEQTAAPETSNTEAETSSSTSSDDYRAKILEAAYSQLGVPYVYGAESPGEALDCSGFTQYCYSQAGIDIPHSSVAQAGMADKSSIDDLQAGDLVFWEGTAGGSASGSHVAIYLGDGQIIHANGTEVAVGTLSGSYTSCGSIS